jgi:hypothetical protein
VPRTPATIRAASASSTPATSGCAQHRPSSQLLLGPFASPRVRVRSTRASASPTPRSPPTCHPRRRTSCSRNGMTLARDPAAAEPLLDRAQHAVLGYHALDAVYRWGRACAERRQPHRVRARRPDLAHRRVRPQHDRPRRLFRGPLAHDARGRSRAGSPTRGQGRPRPRRGDVPPRHRVHRVQRPHRAAHRRNPGTSLAMLGLAIVVCKVAQRRALLWSCAASSTRSPSRPWPSSCCPPTTSRCATT